MVKFGAGKDLARGERFEGAKKEGFIKKRNIRLIFSIIIIGIGLKFTANKEKIWGDTDVQLMLV